MYAEVSTGFLDLPRSERRIELPAHGTPGDEILIDILDRDAIWEALDVDDPA